MNLILLLIDGVPTLEIYFMIKVGQQIGALFTIFLIFLTAVVGLFFARLEGINTLKSGLTNLYRNKSPIFEIISGASIALAAFFLILPGFITDTLGFFLLIPFTRKFLIRVFIKEKKEKESSKNDDFIEAEIIENEENKKDEL